MEKNKILNIFKKYDIDITNRGAKYMMEIFEYYSEELKQSGVKYCMDKLAEKYNISCHTIKSDIRICLAKSKFNNITPKKALFEILYGEIY